MSKLAVPRSFLKWAGGKTQLTSVLLEHRPINFRTYHEPFLGSGALFFCLYRKSLIRQAIISDINQELIDTYLAIRDNVKEVIKILSDFPHNREFYYQIRGLNPWSLPLPLRAARMIYLNKTGYNGLYRVNRKGEFNVPFGRYKSPQYLNKENLLAVSEALQKVEIICTSFETVLDRASEGDWIYFDPPYMPISKTACFTSYFTNNFDLEEQKKLRDFCIQLSQKGVYVTVSNSDTPIMRQLYSSFQIEQVFANRFINCNGRKRGKVAELLIKNY